MPLSLDGLIDSNDIAEITMLKFKKVWLLTGFLGDQIVIKKDSVYTKQYDSVNPIVEAVAPDATLRILAASEVASLNNYVIRFTKLTSDWQNHQATYRANEAPAIAALKVVLTFPEPFVKMRAVRVTDLEKALAKRLAPNADKKDLRTFTATLNASGGLERLGEIIAVDLFNGNTDRFYPGGSGLDTTIGGMTFQLRSLVNVGNVFKIMTDAGNQVGALDFVDPNSPFKDIDQDLATAEQGEGWQGRLLADRTKRKNFAKDVVGDLEKLLNPHKGRFSLRHKLNRNAAERVEHGMVEGTRLIKKKLASLSPTRQGVQQRLQVIQHI